MAKLRNISYIVKEIVINSSTTNYELNGIVGNNLEFYGLDKITRNYKELPKAWYQLIKNNGNYVFKVVDPSIFNYSKIQVALWYDNKSLTYVTEFNPDIKVLVDRYNILVNTVSQLWEYTKRQMIVGDSMEMHLVLPKLKENEIWICKGDHYEAISIVDVNAELRKLIDQYATIYKIELEQKTNEQKLEINKYVQELGTQQKNELDNYKNKKIGELLSKLNDLKNQFQEYVLQKQNEMNGYKQVLQNELYDDSKKEIDDYSKAKIKENEIAIQNKTQEILANLDDSIENKIQLKINALFQAMSPKYLNELKIQIDTYLKDELNKINRILESKIDNYISSKDKLIADKVEDIATKEINKAVAKAKENVINEIEENKNQKVQEAIREFTNQANTLTAQKLKLIEESVNKFIAQDIKKIIGDNVNQYMQSFNVVSSKENGKIKLTFTLKDFKKEIELPNGELPSGSVLLHTINQDVDKNNFILSSFREKLNIPNPVDISGKVDKVINSDGYANIDKSDGLSFHKVAGESYYSHSMMGLLTVCDENNPKCRVAQLGFTNTERLYIRFERNKNGMTSWQRVLTEGTPVFQDRSIESKDLNDYINQYKQGYFTINDYTNMINLPVQKNGIFKLFALQNSYTLQEYITIDNEIYNRFYNYLDKTWGQWVLINPKLETPKIDLPYILNKSLKDIYFKDEQSTLYNVYIHRINASGKIISQDEIISSGNVTAFSDIRLKSNIQKIDNALDKVMKINGYTYDMNNKRNTGVIAQEIEKVLPEVVQDRENGYKTVAYGNMIGLLIEAIKELKSEIEVLKNATKERNH